MDLKLLYVAITRPKNRLIIYDDSLRGRKHLDYYWEQYGLVDRITEAMLNTEEESLTEEQRKLFASTEAVSQNDTT